METKPLVSPNVQSDRFKCSEDGCRKGQCSKDALHCQKVRRTSSQRSVNETREKRDASGKKNVKEEKSSSQKNKIEKSGKSGKSDIPVKSIYIETGKSSYGELSKHSKPADAKSMYVSVPPTADKKKSKKSIKQSRIETSEVKKKISQDSVKPVKHVDKSTMKLSEKNQRVEKKHTETVKNSAKSTKKVENKENRDLKVPKESTKSTKKAEKNLGKLTRRIENRWSVMLLFFISIVASFPLQTFELTFHPNES
ncbi:hypothetical protein L3Y34_014992 [Caenorhabditis briggsae]|uniref:Uncharacterized protein n=1 Tax=Caenorhabditis briggsae TaxID=6238 RepID=A0AAE9DTD1_CAEBR|nr:hypothetical protein L3Y34_014992 [Caenorhabditis briggsae]